MIQDCRHQNKKLIILVLVVLSALAGGVRSQGWQVVSFPTADDLTGIAFSSPDTGFVVTRSGKIARTVNAGKTWGGVQLTKTPLEHVILSGWKYLYVCGENGRVLKSENGGRDWVDRSYNDTNVTLVSIASLSSTDLLATGLTHDSTRRNVGVLLRSYDDGQSWDRIFLEGLGFGELDVDNGVARFCAWGKLYSTSNDGKSWDSLQLPSGKPSRTLDMKGNTGVMVGNFGQVSYSSDKGKTWNQVILPKEESHFTSVVLIDEKRGYIAGTDSKMYSTADGGKTWNRETLPLKCDLFSLVRLGNRIWAIGNGGAMIWKATK